MNHPSEIICGKHAVREVLRAGKRKCFEVIVAEGKQAPHIEEILNLARERHVPCVVRPAHEVEQVAHVEKHQGVAARVEPFRYAEWNDVWKVVLILDSILDPQNCGSLIRTAHQLGVDAVILPKDRSTSIGPAACRAAAGAVEYLPIVQVVNLRNFLKDLKGKGFWTYGAEIEGGQSLYEQNFSKGSVALVLGAEEKGMRRLVKETCDFLITIPMMGNIDSLNVSVAGAIIMAEVMRQRKR